MNQLHFITTSIDTPKKLFGIDKNMRSTRCKYDPCVTGKQGSTECLNGYDNCMVSLISDRFLGQSFIGNVLSKKYSHTKDLFTYVLIADTLGCNLNCWFCYAWKYLDRKEMQKCLPHFLSSNELAKQFACKIRKTVDFDFIKKQVQMKKDYDATDKEKILKHIKLELPFSRIRISGGEPLFSNNFVFQTSDDGEDILTQTTKYWLNFFEELDKLVGEIKQEGLINIAIFQSPWEILPHPVWLTEAEDRIMIRFDTNGLIFSSEKYSGLFYEQLHRLFSQNKLKNIHIQIDYSFKGETTKEYLWSQRKGLPVSADNNNEDKDIDNHPQVKGYKNIRENIARFTKMNPQFGKCVSITVEKGIDHDPKQKVFL